MGDNLEFAEVPGNFRNREEGKVKVMKVSGGPGNAAAFIYQVHLNLDKDGAPNTYGWPNPEGNNSAKDKDLQRNKGEDGLGNACGDPGDGTKGWQNFVNGLGAATPNRNFYWSSVVAIQRTDATERLVVDLRYEAGRTADPVTGAASAMYPAGSGFFPVIQLDGPYRGYFISTTGTYTDRTLPDTNTDKWVNGLTTPYAVWAGEWAKWRIGGKMLFEGDFGLAINNVTGQHSGFFFGDSGTPNKVGEVSGELYRRLGNTDGQPISFIVFPASGFGKEVGKKPENKIRPLMLPRMLDIAQAKNALELPMRLAFGPDMVIPRRQAEMTDTQARTYQNVMAALKHWAIWPKQP